MYEDKNKERSNIMPYKHAGEYGDVWKHLPLCEVLAIENPLRYHESNSAYSGYNISVTPYTEYGILKVLGLNNDEFMNSEYYMVLKKNGIDNLRYTGSPGLAMEILSNNARYFFHDIEREALDDVEAFAKRKGLQDNVKIFCGDSIRAFMDKDYLIDDSDFIFLDPYMPFDINEIGLNFFDIFIKAITAQAKTILWYGYGSLSDQQRILERLKYLASDNKVEIWSFDVWLKSVDAHGFEINPGVPGCGLACAYLSNESVSVMKKYLEFVERCYSHATYNGHEASLLTSVNKFS
jgi:23S rRNA (adenine2030-N6)-methyltransferase